MRSYLPFDPAQSFLLPPNPREWLPRDHLVFFIEETVEALDISAFHEGYADGPGGPPFDPSLLVRVLLYAYARGIRSSRKVERALVEDVSFRVLAGQSLVNFRTLCKFRTRHREALEGLFVQVLRLCQDAGLVPLLHVAVDGTKVHANASKRKAMSVKRLREEEERLSKEIHEWFDESEATDAEEDERFGERRGDELPPALQDKEARRRFIRETLEKIKRREESERAERIARRNDRPFEKAQWNFTDPESRIMPDGADKMHFVQAYNAQVAVDHEHQVIVATSLGVNSIDKPELPIVLDELRHNLGRYPEEMSMDAGYASRENLVILDEFGIDAFVSMSKAKRDIIREKNPRGRPSQSEDPLVLMQRKVQTPRGKRRYALRKQTVEPVIGQMKEAQGFRRFMLRGRLLARMEWSLGCTTHNLRKLFTARPRAA